MKYSSKVTWELNMNKFNVRKSLQTYTFQAKRYLNKTHYAHEIYGNYKVDIQ
jgi:hypothetical protein